MPDEFTQDTPQPVDPAPGATPPAGAGADQETDRYAGKSTAEIAAMHREAQRKITELSQQNSTFRQFFTEVQPWIEVDPNTGKVDLNKKTVLPHIQSEGWLPQQGTPTQDNGNGESTREAFNDVALEDNPKEALTFYYLNKRRKKTLEAATKDIRK
jgi:hypothetical protein